MFLPIGGRPRPHNWMRRGTAGQIATCNGNGVMPSWQQPAAAASNMSAFSVNSLSQASLAAFNVGVAVPAGSTICGFVYGTNSITGLSDNVNGAYTLIEIGIPEFQFFYFYNSKALTTSNTFTFSGTASGIITQIVAVQGAARITNPLDILTSRTSGSGEPLLTTSTPVAAGELAVGFCLQNPGQFMPPTGWTSLATAAGLSTGLNASYQLTTAKSPITYGGGQAPTGWDLIIATFIPAAAGVATLSAAPSASFQTNASSASATISTPTTVAFATPNFNNGGYFASNTWTPPAGVVSIHASISMTAATGDTDTFTAGIYNGATLLAGADGSIVTAGGTFVVSLSCVDQASGASAYTVKVSYAGTGTAPNINSSSLFSGSLLL